MKCYDLYCKNCRCSAGRLLQRHIKALNQIKYNNKKFGTNRPLKIVHKMGFSCIKCIKCENTARMIKKSYNLVLNNNKAIKGAVNINKIKYSQVTKVNLQILIDKEVEIIKKSSSKIFKLRLKDDSILMPETDSIYNKQYKLMLG
jgi:hypothetical protein